MINPRRMDLPQIPQLAVAGPNKVLVYHKETGEAFERWPIDAREMLAEGSYQMHPVGEEAPAPQHEEQQPHVAAAERLMEATDPVGVERMTREAADAADAEAAKAKPAAPAPKAAAKKTPPKKGQPRTSRATSKKGTTKKG